MGDILDVVRAARRDGVALIACRLADGDTRGRALADAGFRRIELLVTFERRIDAGPRVPAELASEADADACAAIATDLFTHDRFHADPNIPDTVAEKIKGRWVLNGVRGRADAAIVVRVNGEVVGFNLCLRRNDIAIIDLIGVARAHQGKGLGRRLVDAALGHYAGMCATMRVGTQDTNTASVALYEGAGFVFAEAHETWHWTP
jgi:ribosomal protein S18 acetylase RimI-like enzyme